MSQIKWLAYLARIQINACRHFREAHFAVFLRCCHIMELIISVAIVCKCVHVIWKAIITRVGDQVIHSSQSLSESASQVVSQLVRLAVCLSISQSVCQGGESLTESVSHSVSLLVSLSVGQSVFKSFMISESVSESSIVIILVSKSIHAINVWSFHKIILSSTGFIGCSGISRLYTRLNWKDETSTCSTRLGSNTGDSTEVTILSSF